MPEASGEQIIQGPLAGMTEGRMPQIVPQSNRFRQVLIQAEGSRDSSRQTGDFQGVRQPCAVMVPFRREEDLRFMLQAAESLGMRNSVHIPLETGADFTLLFRKTAPCRLLCKDAVIPDDEVLQLFPLLPDIQFRFIQFRHKSTLNYLLNCLIRNKSGNSFFPEIFF